MENKKNNIGISKRVFVTIIICVLLVGLVSGIIAGYFMNGKKGDKKSSEKTDSYSSDFDPLKYIEIGDYKNITVNVGVSEDDIKSEINTLLDDHAKYEKKQGKVKDGDKVYAEFSGFIKGKKIDVTCGADYIDVGSGDWLEDFENALKGAVTGKKVKFSCSVPEGTYDDKNVDGHKVDFEITAKYICGKKIVPKFNDRFIKNVSSGKYKTVDEYKKYIRDKLIKENKTDRGDYAWSDVVELCHVKKYPSDMLALAEKENLQGYYDMAEIYGYSIDEVLKQYGYNNLEDFKKYDLKEIAQDTVKENLAAMAIAKLENIKYSDKEYERVLEEEFEYNSEKYATKEEYEKENKEALINEATLNVVKKWLADNLKFDYSKA
ncbi:hypothetical protein KQI69_05735 [Eubacterium sp. MSJ-13]|uniref:FKBP-type peptidyl-prolyl cis-trans isomerase n=1 Tax=Eubacterium sp. MSJ-13 TaxID=2841513 RepID=UPI001C0FF942|nr:FKBP-type peptidyl-prolyl cis-trans isomerase [Eubacterium sp. MSJ-13]MBU5478702.1 hypothetical protein [Eubacterium sp. MSJ-13]